MISHNEVSTVASGTAATQAVTAPTDTGLLVDVEGGYRADPTDGLLSVVIGATTVYRAALLKGGMTVSKRFYVGPGVTLTATLADGSQNKDLNLKYIKVSPVIDAAVLG